MHLRNWAGRIAAVIVLGLSCSLGGVGCATDKAVVAQANQFHTGLQKAVMDDPALSRYIQTVGDRILEAARTLNQQGYKPKSKHDENNQWMFSERVQFHFVNSKTLNAFTTGGEHMYLYNELFQRCKTEDELAAVMCHEYGHVFGRHIHNGMNRQIATMLGAGAVAAAGYAAGGQEHGTQYAGYGAGLGMLAGQLVNAGFSRGDEEEADKLGFDIYVRAGWDPERFGDFFRTMVEQEAKKGGGGAPAFMSTHPSSVSRVQAAERRAKEWEAKGKDFRRPAVAAGRQFRALQERAEEVGRRTPTDETLANAKELLAALPQSCLLPDEPHPQEVQAARQRMTQKGRRQEQLQRQNQQRPQAGAAPRQASEQRRRTAS